jgi:hypothetical protein
MLPGTGKVPFLLLPENHYDTGIDIHPGDAGHYLPFPVICRQQTGRDFKEEERRSI